MLPFKFCVRACANSQLTGLKVLPIPVCFRRDPSGGAAQRSCVHLPPYERSDLAEGSSWRSLSPSPLRPATLPARGRVLVPWPCRLLAQAMATSVGRNARMTEDSEAQRFELWHASTRIVDTTRA